MVKVTFFLLLVFAGLYFFGNFRINDTNVRDFLQQKVTVQKIKVMGQQAMDIYHMMVKLYHQFAPKDQSEKNQKIKNDSLAIPGQSSFLDQLTAKDSEEMLKLIKQHLEKPKSIQKESLDQLTEKDREQMLKLIKQHLEKSN